MCHRQSASPSSDGADAGEERGLTSVAFVGSYPAADFAIQPALPEVAFLGRSNVGKSSLINRLIGRRSLARTSKIPGKTRDCNVYNVDGRFYLVDLPGYGYARTAKSLRRGLSRLITDYLSTRQHLAGVVWLLDIRREPSAEDLQMANLLTERGVPVLVAVTKVDKLGRGRRNERVASILSAVNVPPDQCVVTSAHTREGSRELRASIIALVEKP